MFLVYQACFKVIEKAHQVYIKGNLPMHTFQDGYNKTENGSCWHGEIVLLLRMKNDSRKSGLSHGGICISVFTAAQV